MNENTYMIRDNLGNPIAQKMPLDVAVLLITALCNKYYKEAVGWTIVPDYIEYEDENCYNLLKQEAKK
jgi:hypothetical protein